MSVGTFTQLRSSAALRLRTPSLRATLMVIVPALVAVVGLFLYLIGGRYVSTDNAYVGAQKVLITPEVSGKVMRIAVIEGQLLSPGDELFSIDPAPYRFAAEEAEAKLARVRSDFDNLKSTYGSLGKQIELARQSVAANQAEFDRKTSLLNNRISTPADLDKSRMALAVSKGLLEQLQQQEATVRNQLLGRCRAARREVSPVRRGRRRPRARQARPRQHRAARAHRRHRHAGHQHPDGAVPHRRHGRVQHHRHRQRVGGCQSQGDRPHLRARRDSRSSITVDAFPSRAWRGTVAAISPGTGAQFAILPPQNAAGNWIKIVQRVPLRIEFEAGQDLRRLRSGMSASVEIDTGRRGRLARLLGLERGGPPGPRAMTAQRAPAATTLSAAPDGHHLRDDGGHHAGARHHHRQRLAALHAGEPLRHPRPGELGADLLRGGGGRHDGAGRLARQPLRHQAAAADLRHRLHARLHAVRHRPEHRGDGAVPPAAGHVRRGPGAAGAVGDARASIRRSGGAGPCRCSAWA